MRKKRATPYLPDDLYSVHCPSLMKAKQKESAELQSKIDEFLSVPGNKIKHCYYDQQNENLTLWDAINKINYNDTILLKQPGRHTAIQSIEVLSIEPLLLQNTRTGQKWKPSPTIAGSKYWNIRAIHKVIKKKEEPKKRKSKPAITYEGKGWTLAELITASKHSRPWVNALLTKVRRGQMDVDVMFNCYIFPERMTYKASNGKTYTPKMVEKECCVSEKTAIKWLRAVIEGRKEESCLFKKSRYGRRSGYEKKSG